MRWTSSRDVFKQRSARDIAQSLKRSAEHSTRRKAEPYRSALSMLTFYINRAGTNLPPERKRVLTRPSSSCARPSAGPRLTRPGGCGTPVAAKGASLQ